ncbi:hypothetical protein O9G_002966 [Rozella allomycis CSF55]|uniref:RRM Nup35-type domain-containing protein n=1 Tax=Rozella allomycis (strain CSF55) TaxID=988480 RepID=A0A075B1I8_ROZAC|nr:hypothetical protein O9G_002966 [Rozella allomycis CSF55]|eukprot:EPZ34648.1 hypothetical protein O9G_002966 [Rozella allomycis CSF55]
MGKRRSPMRKVLTSPVAVTQEEADNVSYPPNIHQCIVVFGFPSWSTTNILQDFQSFGDILRYKSPNMHEANNWLLIEYESAWQAQKAIAARNAKLMMNGAFLVGVMPLSKVINRIPKALDFVYEGANQSNFQEQKLQPMAMDISPLPIKSPLKQEQTPAVFIRTTHMMPGSAIPTKIQVRFFEIFNRDVKSKDKFIQFRTNFLRTTVFYTLAFLVTWTPGNAIYSFSVAQAFFSPLRGFSNFLAYFIGSVIRVRNGDISHHTISNDRPHEDNSTFKQKFRAWVQRMPSIANKVKTVQTTKPLPSIVEDKDEEYFEVQDMASMIKSLTEADNMSDLEHNFTSKELSEPIPEPLHEPQLNLHNDQSESVLTDVPERTLTPVCSRQRMISLYSSTPYSSSSPVYSTAVYSTTGDSVASGFRISQYLRDEESKENALEESLNKKPWYRLL